MIAILAVLATAVVLVLNPVQLLAQGRDSTRLSDLAALNSALSLFQADAYTQSLGTPNTVYLSVPDNASSTCGSLGLPLLSSPWIYHCVPSASSTKTDGSGWIPVNLTLISSGSPLSKLPIDPTNTTSSGFYYTYVSGGSYAMTATLESQKYLSSTASQDNGYDPGRYEIGSDLSLIGRSEGLMGWWPLDGDASDRSGNGNNGTWSGSMTGGSYYTQGKINQAGNLNGTDDYVAGGGANIIFGTSSFSGSAWVKSSDVGGNQHRIIGKDFNVSTGYSWLNFGNGNPYLEIKDSDNVHGDVVSGVSIADNQWHYITFVVNRTNNKDYIYIDGALKSSVTPSFTGIFGNSSATNNFCAGAQYGNLPLNGLIDDVRIYNRALSAAEIQAIYNAQK